MTSNLGAREIQKNTPLGFKTVDTEDLSYEEIKEKVMSELKRVFRPEFLNRIDEVIVFHKLTEKQVFNIMDLMMSRLGQALELQGIIIDIKKSAKDLLLKKGYDSTMGARPMRRAIQSLIEDQISEKIIAGEVKSGQKVVVKSKDGKMQFEIKKLSSSGSVLKV
jgi:ATP-dependent Clp protease ATP-binding subunit ClpC